MWVSASMTTTSSCRARAKPSLSCSALPRLTGSRTTRQRGSPPRRPARRRLGAVGGAVVEHQHLELGVVGGERGARRCVAITALLVVRRDQHGHARPAAVRLHRPRRPLVEHPEQHAARDPQRGGARPGTARRMPAALSDVAYRFSWRRARRRQTRARARRRRTTPAVTASPSSIASVWSTTQAATMSATEPQDRTRAQSPRSAGRAMQAQWLEAAARRAVGHHLVQPCHSSRGQADGGYSSRGPSEMPSAGG